MASGQRQALPTAACHLGVPCADVGPGYSVVAASVAPRVKVAAASALHRRHLSEFETHLGMPSLFHFVCFHGFVAGKCHGLCEGFACTISLCFKDTVWKSTPMPSMTKPVCLLEQAAGGNLFVRCLGSLVPQLHPHVVLHQLRGGFRSWSGLTPLLWTCPSQGTAQPHWPTTRTQASRGRYVLGLGQVIHHEWANHGQPVLSYNADLL